MSTETKFIDHTAETAPAASRAHLEGARAQFGFVPNPMAKMASSPAVLEAFAKSHEVFERCSLQPLEREVVTIVIAVFNGCHYCVPMHTAILTRMEAPAELIAALRDETPIANTKLCALAEFTRRVLETRGGPGEGAMGAFLDEGYTHQQALDVVLSVSVFTLTTYAIRLTEAKLDPAFAAFVWKPAAG